MFRFWLFLMLTVIPASSINLASQATQATPRVVIVSVDGLYGELIRTLPPSLLPNLSAILDTSISTSSAYTDPYITRTLPNHLSMATGRFVRQQFNGHCWEANGTPSVDESVHSNCGDYIESIFDIAHDHGHSTALYASKTKFILFQQSWGQENGREDLIGIDNGTNKFDKFQIDTDVSLLVDSVIADIEAQAFDLSFIHLRSPDSVGHIYTWDFFDLDSRYIQSIIEIDTHLGRIHSALDALPSDVEPYLIISADHGGKHNTFDHPSGAITSHRVPMIIWSKGSSASNAYALAECRVNQPENPSVVSEDSLKQPIRNRDIANLALSILRLPLLSQGSRALRFPIRCATPAESIVPTLEFLLRDE